MYKLKDYKFETEAEAKEAQSELRAVDYLRTKVNMDQPEAALEIYRQLLDQDIFHTVVGYDFLKSLQSYLRSSASINNADIPQIPDSLAQSVLPKITEQPAASHTPPKKEAANAAPGPAASLQTQEASSKAKDAPVKEAAQSQKEAASNKPDKKEKKRREKQPKEKKEKEKKPFALFSVEKQKSGSDDDGRYRAMAFTFGATTAILLVAVIVMFAITLTSDNPTILDYETKLQNKYAEWDEELSQKETELKNREADIEFREQALRNQTFAPVESYGEQPPVQAESVGTEEPQVQPEAFDTEESRMQPEAVDTEETVQPQE